MKKVSRLVGALSSAGLLGVTLTLAAGTTTVATAGPVIVHAPRIPGNGHGPKNTWSASNWSGYARTGTFTGVSGTWTVPKANQSASATYSSAWIGVDGFNNSNLIQTGTEEDYYNGAAHYNAWWEILPAAETPLPSSYIVNSGDTMSASIYETATLSGGVVRGHNRSGNQHIWVINISDVGHWSDTFDEAYNGPGTSAEWIMEAPQVGGHIATLNPYTIAPSASGGGNFDHAGVTASIPAGVTSPPPSFTPAGLDYTRDSGVMIQNNVQVSTPGDPGGTNNVAFNVGYGAGYAAPNPLPSTPTS